MNIPCKTPDFPALVPAPDCSSQTDSPILCLDGTWELLHTSAPDQWVSTRDDSIFQKVTVPSQVDHLRSPGFCGAYLYKRRISISPQMAASRVVLRMEGVNGHANVYINGHFAASHKNAFVTWNTEITELIRGQKDFELIITVDERSEKVSTFAHGGILHSVYLYLLPEAYISSVHFTTTFNAAFTDAALRMDYGLRAPENSQIQIHTRLYAPERSSLSDEPAAASAASEPSAQRTIVSEGCVTLEADHGRHSHTFSISHPFTWDAEHPRLYRMELQVELDGTIVETLHKDFGFRQLDRKENQLFINGKEIKLRGSCRHEITARNGRCLTREQIEEDVHLFKEANCNYIRTSHYPPSEYFLDLCDRYGLYVEDELALAFIARSLDYTQQDPQYQTRYLSHFSELVSRDYSHPCVIIWSLCNESFGGYNFDLLNRFAKASDPTRVTKFSYPMTLREEYPSIDIWSIHYSNYNTDLSAPKDNVSVGGAFRNDLPVLHDEYVHIPCYNRTEQRRDPFVREFWGMSIARFWEKIWNTKGALGGAIWAGIDETDIYDGGKTCLEWGIIDPWRRKKPEHYQTRKAYSPIVLRGVNNLTEEIAAEEAPAAKHASTIETAVQIRQENGFLQIPVKNRFCHTNLSETRIHGWFFSHRSIGARCIEDCQNAKSTAPKSFVISGPDIAPFGSGTISLPLDGGSDSDYLYLEWEDAGNQIVDEFLISLSTILSETPAVPDQQIASEQLQSKDSTSAFRIEDEQDTGLCIHGPHFTCRFDKKSGLIHTFSKNDQTLICGGPYMHVPYLKLDDWKKTDFSWSETEQTILVLVSGHYGSIMDVTFYLSIWANGQIDIRYQIDGLHAPLPNAMKLRVGTDCGGLDELGIRLDCVPGTDSLSWERDGSWSIYPQDSIGRNIGQARLEKDISIFGEKPKHPWKNDGRHFVLNGRYDPGIFGNNDFTSLKERLCSASITAHTADASWKILSNPSASTQTHLRLSCHIPDQQTLSCSDPALCYEGTWWNMNNYSSQSSGVEMWSNDPGSCVRCTFSGTGIIWYGPVDVNYGKAEIRLDGISMGIIDQRVDGVDFPGSAAGFDKKFHYPVYSVQNLANGEHTLEIQVLGTHSPDSCDSYIVIESFCVLTLDLQLPVSAFLLQDYNFPHISWGNWNKPAITIQEGDTGTFSIKI